MLLVKIQVKLMLLVLTLVIIAGCSKEIDEPPLAADIVAESQAWSLSKILDNNSNTFSNYPAEKLGSYNLRFATGGRFELLKTCNYKNNGRFESNSGNISFANISLVTAINCGDFTNWESRLIENLKTAKSYTVDDKELVIYCLDNTLFFIKGVAK